MGFDIDGEGRADCGSQGAHAAAQNWVKSGAAALAGAAGVHIDAQANGSSAGRPVCWGSGAFHHGAAVEVRVAARVAVASALGERTPFQNSAAERMVWREVSIQI